METNASENNEIEKGVPEPEPEPETKTESEPENAVIQEEATPTPTNSIALELGDIIEIVSPSNEEVHENTFLITYIDKQKIKLFNTANLKPYQLNITEYGSFTDESIEQIILLNRAEERGYARQNNLLIGTWIDIQFGGEIPVIISGEISNLDEDMIEIVTYPELRTIYIDFGYKGIPDEIPIEKITIRKKPASLNAVVSLSMLRDQMEAEGLEPGEIPDQLEEDLPSIQYTELGESIIHIPDGSKTDVNVRDALKDLYIDANTIIYGEKLEKITQLIEVPENEKRYGIDAQVNDMMDELLSTVPNSQRNKLVLDNIHILIERFKELRTEYSKFDTNNNAYSIKTLGAFYKPLIERLLTFDKKLQWIVPVVSTRRKLYNINASLETPDAIIVEKEGNGLRELETLFSRKKAEQKQPYEDTYNRAQDIMTPFDLPENESACLGTASVLTNIESIVDNLEDFYSSVYMNGEVKRRKFVIQRYNLGLNRLNEEITKSGKKIYNPVRMTPHDKICIKSVMMMPESVFRFTNIELPMTDILTKAQLHQNYFLLFRLLKKNIDIVPHIIDDLSKEFDYDKMEKVDKINFLEGLHEFILDKEVYVDKTEKYQKFLEAIIPKTRFLIQLIRKYIKDKISFVSVVKQLEPFMIYAKDISYKQYVEINSIIRERISEIKKKYNQKTTEFSAIKNAKYNIVPKINPILRLLSEKKDFADSFFQNYHFLAKDKMDTKMSAQELLKRMTDMDNSNLYTNVLTSIMLTLMTPENLLDALSEPALDDMSENEKIKPMDCTRRYLAKKYTSIKDLQKENNTEEAYYDKDYDDTPYHIMKKYEKEKKEMMPELFLEFLIENLVERHDCPRDAAKDLATALITKKKPIRDGDYAILELKPTLPQDMDANSLSQSEKDSIEVEADIRKKTSYYRRIKNVWVVDNEIMEDAFLDTNTLFCNISASCIKNTKNNVCETVDDAAKRMREMAKKNMINEFDKRYTITVDELERELERNIEYCLKMLKHTEMLKEIRSYKANNLAYEIGKLAIEHDIVFSPYLKLRDMILGQDDFAKIQSDICRFVDKFCRKPMTEQLAENENWMYCKETNTKLFPVSIYELATTFISGGDYVRKQNEVCYRVGILSDDGDSIVDKHSGFIIRKIDFNAEEGFDETGFRISTSDILEQDLGTVVMQALGKKEKPIFESETMTSIYNIILSICKNIDVPMDVIQEFIMRTANMIIEKEVYTEETYQKKSDQNLKKTGKHFKTSYKDYRNETMITIVAAALVISIQTAIPAFKIKRTFPGCVRSFSGYPMGGIEDLTGIEYIACVLSKMRLNQEPWNSIAKYKAETLTTRIKTLLENNIMTRPDMDDLYLKKREYLLLNPDLSVPEEHKISKWKHFLPPIVPFDVTKQIRNVTSDFVSELESQMKKGNPHQTESIFVLKTKMIFFGYGIIESINTSVKSKDMILKTSARIPFLENACCNEEIDLTNPIAYFSEENKNIQLYIRGAKQIEKLLTHIKLLSTAYFFNHPEFTGIRYPKIQEGHYEENTYLAVIHYCNFDRQLPIPEEFKIFCNEKPEGYTSKWSLVEKIEFLKKNGKRYSIDDLHQLMKIVSQKNVVHIDKREPFTQVDVLRDVLESLDMTNSQIIAEPLRKLIHEVLEKFNPLVMPDTPSKELNDLTDYLIINNADLYKKIMGFFDQYGTSISDADYQKLHNYLSRVDKWSLDRPMSETKLYYDEGLYTVTQYIVNSIQMITKVYPSVLMSEDGFYKNIPKHWGLSKEHEDDISKFVDKYYEELETFRKDTILVRLLEDVSVRLNQLNIFAQSIPVHTEVVRDFPNDDATKKEPVTKTFYSIFNKLTILELYKYCFYSALYEYISACGDVELVRADKTDKKLKRRANKEEQQDPAMSLQADLTGYDDAVEDADAELTEFHIEVDNPEELKARVCNLLYAFLNIEEKNKASVDFSYAEIQKRVGRSKEKEKQMIIKKLGRMSIEERGVEDMLKNYRLDHWNVGQQKGLFQYDKETYNRERDELLRGLGEEADVGMFDNSNEELMDIYELAKRDEKNQLEEDAGVGRDDYDFTDMGKGFMDGDYYGDEADDDFPEDD